MKIIHTGDSHLGKSSYNVFDENGMNIREKDFIHNFNKIIDDAIELKVDLFIHSGDLFNSVRPSNNSINVAYNGFKRLSNNNIPCILISGNHDMPRRKGTGNLLDLFKEMGNVMVFSEEGIFNMEMKFDIGNINFVMIPYCNSSEKISQNIDNLKCKDGINICICHMSILGSKYKFGEQNEVSLSYTQFKDFDYVALGHFHNYEKISHNMVYSGSPERTSFNEMNNDKGYVIIDIDENHKIEHTFIKLNCRNMLSFKIDCSDFDDPVRTAEHLTNLVNDNKEKIKESIVKLFLDNISFEVYNKLDQKYIKSLFNESMFLNLSFRLKDTTVDYDESQMDFSKKSNRNMSDKFKDWFTEFHKDIKHKDRINEYVLEKIRG